MSIQGETVVEGLDVAREAGAPNTALVKEVGGIEARDILSIALLPRGGQAVADEAPVIAGIEVYEE